MDIKEYIKAADDSNKKLNLDAMVSHRKLEKVVIVSTLVSKVVENTCSYLKHFDIDYEKGPSLGYPLRDYDKTSSLFLVIFREREKAELEAIDREIEFGIASLIYTKPEESPKSFPNVSRMLIIPPQKEFNSGKVALRQAYCAADFISRSMNDSEMKGKTNEMKANYRSDLYIFNGTPKEYSLKS